MFDFWCLNWPKITNCHCWCHLSSFRDEKILKSASFECLNNAYPTSNKAENNLEKWTKITIFVPEIVKNYPVKRSALLGAIVAILVDLSIFFWAINTPKTGTFKSENNIQTIPNKSKTTLRSRKINSLPHNWQKITPQEGQNSTNNHDSRCHQATFWIENTTKLGLLSLKTMLKHFLNNSKQL